MASIVLATLLFGASAEFDACTSIAVGRRATVEGSGIATHNNDCATCDPRIAFIPAKDYAAGTRRPIMPFQMQYPRFVGGERSSTYTAVDGQADTLPLGFIDQVRHTYAYWEGGYPLLNEHGLGFGESTCGGQLVGQSVMTGGEALFSVAELMKLALERCKTARCAIDTMGTFGVEHGFYGEDPGMPGAGESLSVVDSDETWVFHMTGGLANKSATWVAQRVPDDHVAVVANNFIIQHVDCEDKQNFMCSQNIYSNAREANLCDFDTELAFSWLRCYGTDMRTFHYNPALPPIPYYTTLRMWRIQSLANALAAPALTDDPFAFPFSVPVAGKISRADVMNWTRDYYKGTEFDMTLGVLAGPFGNPNRLEGGQGQLDISGQFARGISIPRTTYSVIVEAKPRATSEQSIAWFSTDQPLTGVFVPFFAATTRAAESYHRGRQEVYSRDSAFWAFNFVSNWININFEAMMSMHVGPAMVEQQNYILQRVEELEAQWPAQQDAVNEAQTAMQNHVVSVWWALADELVARFSDGIYTYDNTTKKTLGYPAWWLQMIGYSNDFFRVQWVQFSEFPPPLLLASLPASLLTTKDMASSFLASLRKGNPAAASSFLPGVFIGVMIGASLAVIAMRKQPKMSALRTHLLVQ